MGVRDPGLTPSPASSQDPSAGSWLTASAQYMAVPVVALPLCQTPSLRGNNLIIDEQMLRFSWEIEANFQLFQRF